MDHKIDREYSLPIEKGKKLNNKIFGKRRANSKDGSRSVFFELNGQPRTIEIEDNRLQKNKKKTLKQKIITKIK